MMAEGKDRYQDYKTDAADGKVNWMQQGKNAMTDFKADNLVYLLLLPVARWCITGCLQPFTLQAAQGGAPAANPQGNPM